VGIFSGAADKRRRQMLKTGQEQRAYAKTRRGQLLHSLQSEFDLAPRIAQAVLDEAEASLCLATEGDTTGQRRVVLASREASHGQSLTETATKQVNWTLDGGETDAETLLSQGRKGLRRVRIQRILDEAVAQGALATQEDLAQALEVSVRTIKRDCEALQAAGVWLPLRGNVLSIGRGQTHKGQIVGRWLQGETYDQLVRSTHHNVKCIGRYVQTFVRIVALAQEGLSTMQIAQLSQCGQPLVEEYLAIYEQCDDPVCLDRLAEQLERLQGVAPREATQKKRLS
jgi:hypothetical protein